MASRSDIFLADLDLSTSVDRICFFSSDGHSVHLTDQHPALSSYQDPRQWKPSQKKLHLTVACSAALFASYAASSYSPGADQMSVYWNVSREATLVGITVFTIGFAIAPMCLAPFSEVIGRKPVFLASGAVYVACTLCCGLTRLYSGMIIARFFAGVGSSTFSTMVGGLIADIYDAKTRNTPMAIFSGTAVLGIGLGPLVSGFIAQYSTWRWIFYSQTIVHGLTVLAMLLFFKESRASVILHHKTKLLNDWYDEQEKRGVFAFAQGSEGVTYRIRWKPKDEGTHLSLQKMIARSAARPFQLLFQDPVVFFFSLWAAFSWSVLYICLSAVPIVFQTRYSFTASQATSVFASCCIGAAIATILALYQESVMQSLSGFRLPDGPEAQLYFVCIEGMLLPIGLFMFGWTCYPHIHWIVPTIAIGIATVGITMVYLAVFNYLADVYGVYASSAIAAQSFARNAMGGAFPLVTKQMYEDMTYGGASTLLGGVAALLSMVPWILVLYGPIIRERSRFAKTERQ
ncbi:MFS general substrate transporter [Corynespora cassiicola Philippines]|uniref:MFS general substrate transporter n=1 Tax=Corynespora cassiicola Philippines TaxID=1448308 RepID=A0A2T2N860_CORCC|nr:MFS general substrate transporter [Corynespora cassiicola Philippines]